MPKVCAVGDRRVGERPEGATPGGTDRAPELTAPRRGSEGVDADAEEARRDELGGRPKVDLADRFATLIVTDHDRAIRVGGQRLIVPDGSHPDSVAEHFRDTLLSRARERRPNATQDTWAGLVTALEDVARSRDRADPDTLRLLRQAIDGA